MASIRKTATGAWRAEVYVKGVRDSVTRDTKAEASEWAAKRETELRSISSGAGSKTHTVRDALKTYAEKISPTKRGERWEVIRLALISEIEVQGRAFGDIKLADLQPAHIAAWRDTRVRCIAGASVSREMSLLSHAFNVAHEEWGWLTHNPMKNVRRPPDSPPRDRLISDSEIEAMTLALGYYEGQPVVLSSQRVAVCFLFAIETAMRSGEILSLTSRTVDRERRVAYLPMTKNGSARNVPLSTRAIALLNMLPPVEEGSSLFAVSSASRDALFRKAKEKADIHDLTFHDTRHEAITRLSKKLDVLALSRMSGHTNLSELRTYYNESAEELARRLG